MTETIKIVIVDDHPLVRAGLRAVLEGHAGIEVVAEASDGADVVELARLTSPDVVLMDLSMPRTDGVEATRRLAEECPEVRVVVLTSFTERSRVQRALAAGAIGYVLKDSEPDDLLRAIRSARAGHVPIDPRVAAALLPRDEPRPDGAEAALSSREREVLALVAQGFANKQIAKRLGITEGTVKAHLGRIFRELGVVDRTSAALWARDHGFA